MRRAIGVVVVVVATVVAFGTVGLHAGRTQSPAPAPSAGSGAPVPLTAADAKALLGDWTIVADGMQGPATFSLTLKADGANTVGDLTSAATAPSTITDITRSGETVLLRYAFDYDGNMVPTVITLTPAGEGLDVSFDFADGAYIMAGSATRKKP